MAQYLWQTSLSAQGWREVMSDDSVLYDALNEAVSSFGGTMLHNWVAFGENDFIAVVEMPSNEDMAAFVLAMTVDGYYSQGKTTVLLSFEESDGALGRAAAHHNLS